MAITPLPTPPSRQDPLNFATRADAFLGQLPQFATEANDLALDVNAKQVAAASSASSAATSASSASTSANAAAAAANYRGEWADLTGSLTVPTTVSYAGNIWILTGNIADVTAHTPGVSSVWLLQGVYERVYSIPTDTTAVPFSTYKVTANCNVTMNCSTDGQWVRFLNETGTNNFTVLRNGKTIMGQSQDLNADVEHKSFYLVLFSNDYLIMG